MNKNLLDTIFKAVALGMGVAVITLNILGSINGGHCRKPAGDRSDLPGHCRTE